LSQKDGGKLLYSFALLLISRFDVSIHKKSKVIGQQNNGKNMKKRGKRERGAIYLLHTS
jgi:hypothetical protein